MPIEFTSQEVVKMLSDRLSGKYRATQTELSVAIGITPQYLNDILNNRRSPGKKVLEFLNLTKIIIYRRTS